MSAIANFRQNHLIGLYFFIVSLDSISFSFLGPVLAPLLAHHSSFFSKMPSPFLAYVMYGLVIALLPLVYSLSSPLLGSLSDHWGRKPVILGCLVMILLSFVSYGFAFYFSNLLLLVVARIFAGIGCASECIAQAAVMDIVEPKMKPQAVSFIAMAMTMGLLLGPLIASIWTDQSNMYIFGFIVVSVLLAIVLLCKVSVHSVFVQPSQAPAWSFLWNHIAIKRWLLVFLLFEMGWSLYFQTIPLTLSIHWQQGHTSVGLIGSCIGGMLILFLFTATRVGLRVTSSQQLIRLGFLLGIASFLANILTPNLLLFALYAVPTVLSVALIYPCIIAMLSNLSERHHGFIMGVAGTLLSFSFALSGLLSSLMTYFYYGLPFIVAGLCWVGALLLIRK